MSSSKLHMCSPFLRGFLPGIVIGVFTSLLLFTLWRYPPADVRLEVAVSSITREKPRGGVQLQESENTAAAEYFLDIQRKTDRSKSISDLAEASAATIVGAYVLLVLVHSSPGQRSLRDAVRETWLRQRSRRNDYIARFVLGTRALSEDSLASLVAENEEHKDLLVLPDIEEDVNAEWPSSWKLLESFSWAVSHVNFTYVLKCNAATFALLDRLLVALQHQTRHIWGYFAGGVKAVRHSDTSVLVEEDWNLCSHYLPFPEGGGYVISRDLVELVVEMGPDLKHYHHDDIALGMWLSPFKSVTKQHSVWFNSGYYSRGCQNSYLVSHRESVESMRAKFSTLQSKGVLCVSEYQSRLSYHYNWNAPASHCCIRKVGIP